MNKKILVAILALSLMQTTPAQAGFFDFFKTQIAAISLAFSNLFRLSTPPRVTSDDAVLPTTEETSPVSPLGEDPNNYQVGTELVEQPSAADCTPVDISHRCSYLENDQAVSNSCLNPLAVKTGSTINGSGRTGN